MAKSFNDLPSAVQTGILAGAALLLAGGVFYMYVWPLSAKRASLEAQVNKLRAENLKNQAVERERTELLNRIQQLAQQLETRRMIVPDEPAQDQFVKMVYDTARSSSIFLRSFVAQAPAARELFIEMPFNVRIDGTYYEIQNFFDRLASQERIVSVVGLALGPPKGGGQGTYTILPGETVGANCVVITYYNRPAPPPPPPGPPPRRR